MLDDADPRGNHANLVRLNGVSEYIKDLVLKKNGIMTLENDKKMTKMTLKTLSFTKNIDRHPVREEKRFVHYGATSHDHVNKNNEQQNTTRQCKIHEGSLYLLINVRSLQL